MDTTAKPVAEETAAAETAPNPNACRVQVSPDRCRVVLEADDPLGDTALTVETILAACQELALPRLPDGEELLALLQEACTPGEPITDLPLVTSRPPTPPIDGRLAWTKDYFTAGWAIDAQTGAIDFWEKIDNRNVTADELLVTVVDPIEGTPGEDVFGAVINVEKPKTAKIRCGKGVHQDDVDGGTGVFATIGGKVRFTDGTVAVDEVYAIKGDVSLETGNVHHNGTVIIEGDVREGATINVLGDVEVKGMLEPCTITAGGSLTVGGGLIGDEHHAIEVGGNLQARYIHQAVIQAGGDVMAVSEIAHSHIQSRGKVDVSQGRIAGGYTLARLGILVAEAGAGGSAKTELVAGVDPTLKPQVKALRDRIRKIEAARRNILETLQIHETSNQGSSPARQQFLTGLQARAEALAEAAKDTEKNLRRLQRDAGRTARQEIVIFNEVRSGTIIQLGEQSTRVVSSIFKPRIAQRHGSHVCILPMGEGNTPEE